jgi:hypothetical protein
VESEYDDPGAPHASQLRRAVGLVVDWAVSLLISALFVHGRVALWPLLVLAVMNVVLVTMIGTTLGMRVAGTKIIPWGPGSPWPLRVAVRTVLLLLVVPAAIGGASGRPLHDRIAGTAIVRVSRGEAGKGPEHGDHDT